MFRRGRTEVSNKVSRGDTGSPFSVTNGVVGLNIQAEGLVSFGELFETTFVLIDDVLPFLELSVPDSVAQRGRRREKQDRAGTYRALRPS